jgi:hypothetical protein
VAVTTGWSLVLDQQPQLVMHRPDDADRERGLQLIRTLRQTELGRSIYLMVLTRPDDDERLTDGPRRRRRRLP